METACPGFAETQFIGHVVETRAFKIVTADQFCLFVRQVADRAADQGEELGLAVGLLRVLSGINEGALAGVAVGSRCDQASGHGGRHCRQVIGQCSFGFGGAEPGRAGYRDVFDRAFADARGRLQTVQTFVGSAGKTRRRSHAIDDRAPDPEIRVAAEWNTARFVEATRGVPEPLPPETEQFFEFARATERAQNLARDHVHQPQG